MEQLPDVKRANHSQLCQIVMDYLLHEAETPPKHYMNEIMQQLNRRDSYPEEVYIANQVYTSFKRIYNIIDNYIIELVLKMGYDCQDLVPHDIKISFELDTQHSLEPSSFWIAIIQRIIHQLEQDMNL